MNHEQLYEDKNTIYYVHERKEILPYVPADIKSALDIGCGTGAFGHVLKQERGCTVWGVEPTKTACDEASLKLDKAIHGLFVKDMPELAGQKFDAIFFNDVLEHLADPGEALENCKNLLSDNGYIIASIPNIRWYPIMLSLLRYKDFKYANAGVMDKTHLRFFTKKSMIRLYEEAGYKVQNIVGINKDNSYTYFNILNALLLNSQEDMKYPQFLVVAQTK